MQEYPFFWERRPPHQHTQEDRGVTYQARQTDPDGNWLAKRARRGGAVIYASPGNYATMDADVSAGNGQGHENMQPFLVLNFCIALQGVFPPR